MCYIYTKVNICLLNTHSSHSKYPDLRDQAFSKRKRIDIPVTIEIGKALRNTSGIETERPKLLKVGAFHKNLPGCNHYSDILFKKCALKRSCFNLWAN